MRREGLLRSLAIAGITVGVVVGFWYARAPEATLVKVGQAAPELELPSLGGSGTTRLSAFRGHPVVLVMFLAGCHICEAETPEIERLHRAYLRRGLRVIGVSVDKERSTRERFVRRHGVTFIVLEDTNGQAVRAAYGSWKFPEAYLIDAAGKVDAIYLGSVDWRGSEVRDRILGLLPPEPEGAP